MTPAAVVVAGAPGTGKTTLARALAVRLDAAIADGDAVWGAFLAADPAGWTRIREPAYAALADVAADQLALGRSVVLVAPFTAERRDPARWAALAGRLRAAGAAGVTLVWATLPTAEIERRMRARGAERDDDKLADWPAFLALSRPDEPPASAHVRADTSRPPAEVVAEVAAYLKTTRADA